MKHNYKKRKRDWIYLLVPLVYLLCTYNSHAQTTYLKLNNSNGTSSYVALQDIRKITFKDLVTQNPNELKKISSILNTLKAYPIPANQQVTVEYTLTDASAIDINIYDLTGNKVYQSQINQSQAGTYSFVWNATDLTGAKVATGNYVCRVNAGTSELSKKLLIIK